MASGETVELTELVGRIVTVVWRDPFVAWSGGPGELPSTIECRTHGRLLGTRTGPVGDELGIAAEDVSGDGEWRAATAIPACVVVNVLPLAEEGPLTMRRAK